MEVRVEKREFRAETVLLAACRKLSFSFLAHDQEKKVWRVGMVMREGHAF